MSDVQASSGPRFAVGTSDREIEAAAIRAAVNRKRRVRLWQWGLLLSFLGSWELAARYEWIDPFFYAMPSSIVGRLWDWLSEGTAEGSLWVHLWTTMEESLLGFFSGAFFGIVVGIVLGRNKMASDVVSPFIKVLNSIPRVVLAPFFVMFFGLGLGSKVALAFVMVFFVVFANAFQGVREADRAMIANAQILGASPSQVTRAVVIPSAMTWIFASLHVSFGMAIIGAIVGEYVGAKHGIGLLIEVAKGSFDTAGMFAAIVLIVIFALSAEWVVTHIENMLLKWRPAPFQDQGH